MKLIYFNQPDEEDDMYGLVKVNDNDADIASMGRIYAGHSIKDLADKIIELRLEYENIPAINLNQRFSPRVIKLNQKEEKEFEKLLIKSKGNIV